jgi:putative ribosome biogenesis GTPase RsgA
VAGEIPAVVLVNKSDLAKRAKFASDRLEALCSQKGWRWMMASAKTGENVPGAFELIARLHIEKLQRSRPPDAAPE